MTKQTDIILPASIDTKSIIDDLGRIPAERLFLMLSYIYTVGQWKFNWKDARLEVHSSMLKKLGGSSSQKSGNIKEGEKGGEEENKESVSITPPKSGNIEEGKKREEKGYNYLLNYAADKNIITRFKSYKVGESSKEVRYIDRNICFAKQQLYTLTAANAIKAYNKQIEHSRVSFYSRSATHNKIFTSVDQLVYDLPSAWEFISNLQDEKKRATLHWFHYYIKGGFQCWKVDEQGRIYTMPVVIPRELRRFLSWNGEELFQIDISHSQPLLHTLLYNLYDQECDEKYKYLALCESASLYDFLNNQLKNPFDLENENAKRLFKDMVFGEVFYGHPKSKSCLTSELLKIMHKEFPLLTKILTDVKDKDHSVLPRIMQAIEADIIMDGVVKELTNESFPIVTIHDAIMTTKDGLAKVRRQIETTFRELSMSPKLKETK